ncbi:heavy-metal-associated domain-containing protein [Gemmata sp.]|uniref:heavy-metal-associated domain-containing protein n=1 Tax=Gemmata sp. TaxID=1914242 RepID=UPI003F6FE83E
MTEQKYKTNLNCGRCVAAVTPHLNGEGRITRWSVDTKSPDKVLTVEGEGVGREAVERLVAAAGFRVLGEIDPARGPGGNGTAHADARPAEKPAAPPAAGAEPRASYYPIILLFGFLVLGTGLLEAQAGAFEWPRAMARFMGGFFLTFAFFKLLDVRGFADAYAGYDVIAARWRAYGYAYPFIELLLGAAYLSGFRPTITNAVTLVVMSVGTVGVVRTLLARRKIRCACLGAVFNLPMSYVTLAEDGLMAAMAAVMLVGAGHG